MNCDSTSGDSELGTWVKCHPSPVQASSYRKPDLPNGVDANASVPFVVASIGSKTEVNTDSSTNAASSTMI
jgi:hypothetical protein